MDRPKFRHQTAIWVRNYEVDWQGIVHNAVYLHYCEVGRIEYLKDLGIKIDIRSINGDSKVVLVRNEIDYKAPARFDDLLTIYTRTVYIRNSSFAMECLIERASSGELIATNTAYHVWLDPATNAPRTVSSEFRDIIQKYEGPQCDVSFTDPLV